MLTRRAVEHIFVPPGICWGIRTRDHRTRCAWEGQEYETGWSHVGLCAGDNRKKQEEGLRLLEESQRLLTLIALGVAKIGRAHV